MNLDDFIDFFSILYVVKTDDKLNEKRFIGEFANSKHKQFTAYNLKVSKENIFDIKLFHKPINTIPDFDLNLIILKLNEDNGSEVVFELETDYILSNSTIDKTFDQGEYLIIPMSFKNWNLNPT